MKSPVKITIAKIHGVYAFNIEGEFNDNQKMIGGKINASDLFSLMSLDQYYACVKDGQTQFFMPDYHNLKLYIHG